MEPRELRRRVAEDLLKELRAGKLEWYYISMASPGQFHGGFLVQARGPTEAWQYLHTLNWWEPNCSTETGGPVDERIIAALPPGYLWRKLNKTEVESIDKYAADVQAVGKGVEHEHQRP